MTVADNKRVAQRFLDDALNRKDFAALPALFADERVDHFTGSLTTYLTLAAFPDLQVSPEHMIGEGDIVTVLATFTGTHRGEVLGVPPTQKGVTGRVAFTFRLADGEIAETWAEIEPWTLLQQIGASGLN